MHAPRLPIIPSDLLKQYQVEDVGDTRFRACARLLQSMWREDQQLPVAAISKRMSTIDVWEAGLTELQARLAVTS